MTNGKYKIHKIRRKRSNLMSNCYK